MRRTLFVALAAGAAFVLAPAQESQAGAVAEPAAKDTASKSDVDTARTFGLIGMAFGVLGFVSAMAARRRRSDAS